MNDRISMLTVTKKKQFNSKSTPTAIRIFRSKKEQSELFSNNVHAPYIGMTSPQEKSFLTDDSYKYIQKTMKISII